MGNWARRSDRQFPKGLEHEVMAILEGNWAAGQNVGYGAVTPVAHTLMCRLCNFNSVGSVSEHILKRKGRVYKRPCARKYSLLVMVILGLQVIVFLHLLGGGVGQPNSRSVLSSSSLSRVVVSRTTGDVFLADQDTVYPLPGDLSKITSNVSRTAGQTPEGMSLSK